MYCEYIMHMNLPTNNDMLYTHNAYKVAYFKKLHLLSLFLAVELLKTKFFTLWARSPYSLGRYIFLKEFVWVNTVYALCLLKQWKWFTHSCTYRVCASYMTVHSDVHNVSPLFIMDKNLHYFSAVQHETFESLVLNIEFVYHCYCGSN